MLRATIVDNRLCDVFVDRCYDTGVYNWHGSNRKKKSFYLIYYEAICYGFTVYVL